MGEWINNDGLKIRFGTDEAKDAILGERVNYGSHRLVEGTVNWDDLEAPGTVTLLSDTFNIPSGARIEKAEIYVEDAFAGGGTLDLGLVRDDYTTELDYDGFDAAVATAALTAGATIACDGALIDTDLANSGKVTARVNTTAFSAGKLKFRVSFYMPL